MFEINSQTSSQNAVLSPSQDGLEQHFQAPPGPPREQPRQGRSGVRTAAIISLILLLLVVFVIGGFAGWVYAGTKSSTSASSASPSSATSLQTQMESVTAKVKPGIVEVYVTLPNNEAAIGSGVTVDSRGYIVTNNHVVSGALTIQVILSDGTREAAQLAGADSNYDLAVLKIAVPQGGLSVANLGDSTQLQVGQQVLVIGNPLGETETVTHGIVSALKRTVSEGQGAPTIQNAIQTDAAINPGNSGGALVDLQGNVIGIPTLTAIDPEFNTPANGVGFAIPINRVKTILPQIIQQG